MLSEALMVAAGHIFDKKFDQAAAELRRAHDMLTNAGESVTFGGDDLLALRVLLLSASGLLDDVHREV